MSNLGIHLVYAAFNQIPGVVCHRAFASAPVTTHRLTPHLHKSKTIETNEPFSNYDVVAFALNYENDVLNLPRLLLASGIPPLSADRQKNDPFVIAGGVIATINPEPLASIIDTFVLGEAEHIIPEIVEVLAETWVPFRDRVSTISALGSIPGIYNPGWFTATYNQSERLSSVEFNQSGARPVMFRRTIKLLDDIPGGMVIHTPHTEFSGMHLVEISRGCPRNCRFCLIPGCYGPFRYRSALSVQKMCETAPPGWRIGLLGAGGADHPELLDICQTLHDQKFLFSFSSMHASKISPELAALVHLSGTRTLTLAPETGSDSRRKKIGKDFSNQDIENAILQVAVAPVKMIKLYFIIGLPGETTDDLDAIIELSMHVQNLIRLANRGSKTIPRLTVGMSCFVPKAFSSFERAPMSSEKELKKKLHYVLSGLSSIREIKCTHDVPKAAVIQGILARGDRRLTDWLIRAATPGYDWQEDLKRMNISCKIGLNESLNFSKLLPWNHLKLPLYPENY